MTNTRTRSTQPPTNPETRPSGTPIRTENTTDRTTTSSGGPRAPDHAGADVVELVVGAEPVLAADGGASLGNFTPSASRVWLKSNGAIHGAKIGEDHEDDGDRRRRRAGSSGPGPWCSRSCLTQDLAHQYLTLGSTSALMMSTDQADHHHDDGEERHQALHGDVVAGVEVLRPARCRARAS